MLNSPAIGIFRHQFSLSVHVGQSHHISSTNLR